MSDPWYDWLPQPGEPSFSTVVYVREWSQRTERETYVIEGDVLVRRSITGDELAARVLAHAFPQAQWDAP